MTENQISALILETSVEIHRKYGPGLLETVYEALLYHELKKRKMHLKRQVPIALVHDEEVIDISFRADLIVEDLVIIEIKSVENLAPVHFKQLLTYLKISGLKLGLLINFNEVYVKDGFRRVVNNL